MNDIIQKLIDDIDPQFIHTIEDINDLLMEYDSKNKDTDIRLHEAAYYLRNIQIAINKRFMNINQTVEDIP